jgi:hypothetical protein
VNERAQMNECLHSSLLPERGSNGDDRAMGSCRAPAE